MGKVSGSYESVVRGVSEQNPQARRSGQHFAQVNMVSDPVRGNARRHGSVMQDESLLDVAAANYADLLADTANHRVVTFFVGGVEYDLIVRTAANDGGREAFAFCFNKETRQFIPISALAIDPIYDQLVAGGVSASVSVGRYLFLAGNSILPEIETFDAWGDDDNQKLLAGWVRGGAYSRKFIVTVTRASDNVRISGEYKTVTSSYPGVLDTSDILTSDPDYQKKVNDRTNDYNTAVTQWIGTSAEDITPENIAQKLVDDLIANGVSGSDVQRIGAYVVVNSATYNEIEMEDSGDGTLVRGVGNTVDNIDLVSSRHYVGKIVKVAPDDTGDNAVYLKAFARDGVSTGWTEVVWREAAGYIMTPLVAFCMATVEAGTFYIGGGPTQLGSVSGLVVPPYKANSVGDDLSSPLPEFFGRTINYLGVFQDRLVVGAGSTLLFSRPGDYLNWFRKSVVSVEDDDPWEGFALGSEDDTIKYSVIYDRNLLLYGRRFQYVVSGRQTFTPKTASIVIATAYEDAIDAAPQASGNFVYYAKVTGIPGREVASLHQVQPGLTNDNPDSYTASQQLDTYLAGIPSEIVPMTAPNMVLFRTSKDRKRVFTYSYLDNPNTNERLFDAWSHWQWHSGVGDIVGLSKHKSDILIYMIKTGVNHTTGLPAVWVSCERFTRDTTLSDFPYMDSLRPVGDYTSPAANAFLTEESTFLDAVSVAIDTTEDTRFIGDAIDKLDDFIVDYADQIPACWVGIEYPAFFTPTNPYAKDRNDQPILTGRLTITKANISVADTGGMLVSVTSRGQTKTSLNFSGRILGDPSNLIGIQPIVDTNLNAFLGGETREMRYTISAVRWLPLTVTAIEWTGQFFFNTKRA